ncbi:MAG: response regulator transcription factor [Lachnospiraceae bacterium]|nr:response regulator transcription factor [Lachnospiraceae bacterium]MBR2532633.1 response regulator transcription factor [Lachnospiraceae bacterium]
MADKVLIVDDDKSVIDILYKVIRSNGIEADLAHSGEEALVMAGSSSYDLILLDINMHGIDGFEVIRTLRERGYTTPIIVVSGRKEDYDMIFGLDIGADDYITKPFNPVTLGAKVKAMLRRSKGSLQGRENTIEAGPFVYNTSTLRLYKNGQELNLTSKENAMMKLFLDNVNSIFSKDMIYEMIWGDSIIDENAIMVYINRLRQKIEDDPSHPAFIQNVRGLGYRFVIE